MKPIQGAESLQAGFGVGAVGNQSFQSSSGGLVASRDQEPLRCIPLPAVWTFHGGDEPGGVQPVQSRNFSQRGVIRINAVDAPLVLPRPEVDAFLKILGNPFGV